MILSMGKPKASTGIRLGDDQIAAVQRLADQGRLSKTAVMRQLIDEALKARDGRSVQDEPAHLPPSADDALDFHYTMLPVADVAAAGSDRAAQLVDSDELIAVVNSAARDAKRHNWKVVRVIGDSMEPSFLDGDFVLVEPCNDVARVKPRDVVYVRFNGDPQIKELHMGRKRDRLVLVPRNTRVHSPMPVLGSDTLELLGIVRDLARRVDAGRKL